MFSLYPFVTSLTPPSVLQFPQAAWHRLLADTNENQTTQQTRREQRRRQKAAAHSSPDLPLTTRSAQRNPDAP